MEVGRSIAELIPAGAATAQGDGGAAAPEVASAATCSPCEFAGPSDEAEWICDRILAMRGLAVPGHGRRQSREGLSWSDFAVLFRSVAKDAGPLVAELRKRDIPYVVKGLNRLFDSPEIQAVVGIFRYMDSRHRSSLPCASSVEDARSAPGGRQLVRGRGRAGRGPRLRPG